MPIQKKHFMLQTSMVGFQCAVHHGTSWDSGAVPESQEWLSVFKTTDLIQYEIHLVYKTNFFTFYQGKEKEQDPKNMANENRRFFLSKIDL